MTTAPLSQYEATLQGFREALLRRDAATLNLVDRRWRVVQRSILQDIDKLLLSLDKEITPNKLRRLQRFRDLLQQIESQVGTMSVDLAPLIQAGQEAAVILAGTHAEGLVRAQLGERVTWNTLPVNQVQELIGRLSDGSPVSEYLAKFGSAAATAAEETLLGGIATGKGVKLIAADLAKIFGQSGTVDPGSVGRRAMVTARQAVLSSYRSAGLESMKQNRDVVQKWRWLSAKQPGRTCTLCYAMDGQEFDLDVPFSSHIACRCSCVPVTVGWEALGISGVPETRPTIEDGPTAFARLSEAEQRGILGKGRYEMYRNGTPLSAFIQETRDPKWGKGRQVRALRDTKNTPPPLVELGNFKTLVDATRWAKSKYPSIEWDFEGVHIDTINPSLVEFDRLGKRYPEVMDRLKYVGTYQGKNPIHPNGFDWEGDGDPVAHASLDDGSYMGLNPRYFGDPQRLKESDAEFVRTKWLHKGTTGPGATISHEFGHLLDVQLRTVGDGVIPYVSSDGLGTVSGTLAQWRSKFSPTRSLSIYSTTNMDEAFAEAFSMIQHVPSKEWTPYVRRFADVLDFLESTPRTPKAKVQYVPLIRKQTERDRATTALRELRERLGID